MGQGKDHGYCSRPLPIPGLGHINIAHVLLYLFSFDLIEPENMVSIMLDFILRDDIDGRGVTCSHHVTQSSIINT